MADIENTSRRDPVVHLVGGLIGADEYIETMEVAGQQQVVHSDRLPTRLAPGTTEADLIALGITLGEPDPDDPLFRSATLPPGWTRRAGEGPLNTYVVDEHGRRRLGVFYKAAFYDRRAELSVYNTVAYTFDLLTVEGTPLVIDEWATGDALIAQVQRERASEVIYRAKAGAVGDVDVAADCTKRIARCDELITQIQQHIAAAGGEVSGEGGEGSG